ncbi:MAG: BREX system P-loop protein BrxC [Armatimonadetes bacterium]|nr:BREX system P-loop protein BrxC [Armatimonadota bacterium]
MMLNKDVFLRDPTSYALPNDGVAKVAFPSTPEEWDVARYELEHFVCEGAYHDGLLRILERFLGRLDEPVQAGVWVHGFFGSGKSQLLRVLDFLWRDTKFPDGVRARSLVPSLSTDIADALTELSTAGRQRGGLWSAAGTLGAGSGDDPCLAILQVVLRAMGIPERVNVAQFDLWLREEGVRDQVAESLKRAGRVYEKELSNLFVSDSLATAILDAKPGFASSPPDVRLALREQFPNVQALTTDQMVEMMRRVFAQVSTSTDRYPLVLLILDELQQYIGSQPDRSASILDAVESCVREFGSQLLFVAAGQSALTPDTPMSRLQGRFTLHVALGDRDVEKVLRRTVLRKKPEAVSQLSEILENAKGEIDRHLGGTSIASTPADHDTLVADYPVLPTRRRFWEAALRGVDTAGAAQLRTQLRLAFEAAREVGDHPIGTVVGADFIFEQLRVSLVEKQVLLRELEERIDQQDDRTPEGKLRSQICGLLFLVEKLNTTLGVRANVDTLADLLVTDLRAGSAALRQSLPGLLQRLVEDGIVSQVQDEFRLQTREGQVWDADYRSRMAGIIADEARTGPERETRLRKAVESSLANLNLSQGEARTPRGLALHYSPEPPPVADQVPVWVRSEWDVTLAAVKNEAAQAGPDSPKVFVFLPRRSADDLRSNIAGYLAAGEVLDTRPAPTTPEGRDAKAGTEARRRAHEEAIGEIVSGILDDASVFQGGAQQVDGIGLASAVELAANSAVVRLFPEYHKADAAAAKWSSVASKARQGAPDAMSAVQYSGDARQHPVCAAVLAFLGPSGRSGTETRRHFEASPFGWPRDAIDAALLVLCQDTSVSARKDARELNVADLTATAIQTAQFRAEDIIVSAAQRIAIRGLLQNAQVACEAGQELAGAQEFIQKLDQLAEKAGGSPPLPTRPTSVELEDVRSLAGNAMLLGICERLEPLKETFTRWEALSETAKSRVKSWDKLQRLLTHANGLSVHDEVEHAAHAITSERTLLSEPDPVAPLNARLAQTLREAVNQARNEHLEAYDARLCEMESDSAWQNLTPDKQSAIRERNQLGAIPELHVGTDEELLATLDATSLGSWADKTDAVSARISRALTEAARELAPETVHVAPQPVTIHSREELDTYLDTLRQRIMECIEAGNPVVLP